MSHACKISGVSRQHGHRVSHANNKTKHVFRANLQTRRIYVPSAKKYVRVKVSTRIIRTIDKIGIDATLRKHGLTLKDLLS
jgi:large subunit ribosomal protein L28